MTNHKTQLLWGIQRRLTGESLWVVSGLALASCGGGGGGGSSSRPIVADAGRSFVNGDVTFTVAPNGVIVGVIEETDAPINFGTLTEALRDQGVLSSYQGQGITLTISDSRIINPQEAEFRANFVANGQSVQFDYTYTINGPDADDFRFELAGGGDLRLVSVNPADFENPTDANGDNTYEYALTLSTTDPRFLPTDRVDVSQWLLTITDDGDDYFVDVNEGDTSFEINVDDLGLATEAPTITGDDAGDVEVVVVSGEAVIRFTATPDHANPTDNNGDNVYEFIVTDSNTGESVEVEITVIDVI